MNESGAEDEDEVIRRVVDGLAPLSEERRARLALLLAPEPPLRK